MIVIEEIKNIDDYLEVYGWHFNEKLCQYAVSKMMRDGKVIECMNKECVDTLLSQNNITLANNTDHDYVFVCNMGKADYLGSSIPDEKHLALYVKDTIDDEDVPDGFIMKRWYATIDEEQCPINWNDIF